MDVLLVRKLILAHIAVVPSLFGGVVPYVVVILLYRLHIYCDLLGLPLVRTLPRNAAPYSRFYGYNTSPYKYCTPYLPRGRYW